MLTVGSMHILASFRDEFSLLMHVPSGAITWRVSWWADDPEKWSFSASPQRLVIAQAQNVGVFDMTDGHHIATFSMDAAIEFCKITPDGRTVICVDALGNVHILELQEGRGETN